MSMAITFKRILHPIGQGAFFSEHFQEEGEERAFCNAVYDCGSCTGLKSADPLKYKVSELVVKEIRNTYEDGDKIDLLFISHFDEDHTNGLEVIMEQGLITKDTKVIIPFNYPYLLMVMDEDYPSLARFVMQVFNLGGQLIGVELSNDENSFGEPIDIDDLNSSIKLGRKLVILANKKGAPLWYFYPFVLPRLKSLQHVFIEKIKEEKAKGEDIDLKDLDDPEKIILKRSLLRGIYQKIGKTRNKVTKINVNSLLMASFPAVNIGKRARIWHLAQFHNYIYPACFYTGDSNLKGLDYDEAVKTAQNAIDHYSKGTRVGLMQIPHHGSRRCYPVQMAYNDNVFAEIAFVNCNPKQGKKIFDRTIIEDFNRNCRELLLITDYINSCVEVKVEL